MGAEVTNSDEALRNVESDASDEEVSMEVGTIWGDAVKEGWGDDARPEWVRAEDTLGRPVVNHG